jgi:hypothetical protein
VDCAKQMKALNSNLIEYRSAITYELLSELSWETQESRLHDTYRKALESHLANS